MFHSKFAQLCSLYRITVSNLGSEHLFKLTEICLVTSLPSYINTSAEDVGHQKLAAQYIYRELREADEANFLDEEGKYYILYRERVTNLFVHVLYHTLIRKEICDKQI